MADEHTDDTDRSGGDAVPPPSRIERWEAAPRLGPLVRATRRFFDINGPDLGALVAVELFTTVLPILLIGFAWFEHFHPNESIGDLFLEQLAVKGALADTVRSEFGNAAGLHPVWSFVGVMSYLVWGIPMSLTVARVFAEAWARPVHSILQRIWRGSLWFALYVLSLLINHRLAVYDGPLSLRLLFIPLAFAVSVVFWGTSPMLLARNVPRTWRVLVVAGLTGALVMVLMRSIVIQIVFPLLLGGWDGFGPIGVAFTLMTWCGVNGVAWVAIACLGATFTEPGRAAAPLAEASGAAG